ncbi:hypothetical protein C8J56DRAFT_1001157 [Mycena floridula]|nr:hypothetical protein C8J56DRAFT_1001157 [Mycena floridula]
MLSSHLTVLQDSAARFPDAPAFKVPILEAGHVREWQTITYRQFQHDVEVYARYWSRILSADHVPRGSVVGLWIGGYTYSDLLHIYGVSRASYIPQLFSLRLPSPEVIFELLHKADAKTLIFDKTFEHVLVDCPVSCHLAVPHSQVDGADEPLPQMADVSLDDTVFFLHTSGSTSGSPKLVPYSYRWLGSAIVKSKQIMTPRDPQRQDVTTWMGSCAHVGQTFMLLGSIQHGSCTIQPTKLPFDSNEFVDMIQRCRLNRLNQFAAFLATRFEESKQDPKLLSLLAGLDEVLYSGMPLPRQVEEYAYRAGIRLKNLFGSTECGATLLSAVNSPLLRPLEGTSYGFIPIHPTQQESEHQSTARMLEFVVLAESSDCPHQSLRAADGHFHTGDLFQESAPGSGTYVFRGRDDDWIKSENSLRCDTKAIEDQTRLQVGNLIAECIVVGSGRPSPAMFVEPASDMDHEKLKKEIIRKTRQFHSRRYLHERITSPDFIFIVERGTLPRTATKGNIRRKAVEDAYQTQLDQLYALVR